METITSGVILIDCSTFCENAHARNLGLMTLFFFPLQDSILVKTRQDTRLPKSRAGGQERCRRRSQEYFGRSSKLKKLKNAEKVKRGRTDVPTQWGVVSRSTRLRKNMK